MYDTSGVLGRARLAAELRWPWICDPATSSRAWTAWR